MFSSAVVVVVVGRQSSHIEVTKPTDSIQSILISQRSKWTGSGIHLSGWHPSSYFVEATSGGSRESPDWP